MSEVSFAKTFLAALDSRPQKFSADHIEDARSYPSRTPYILPRMPKAMSQARARAAAPGQERSVTVTLRSLRNPPLDVKLAAQPLTTSLLEVKAALAAQTGLAPDKLRLLYGKKPVADSKVLRDVVGDGDTAVEFSVMVMGGAAAKAEQPAAAVAAGSSSTAQGPSGREVVESEAFWNDLRGFLLQRVRDEKQADELFSQFLRAWEENA